MSLPAPTSPHSKPSRAAMGVAIAVAGLAAMAALGLMVWGPEDGTALDAAAASDPHSGGALGGAADGLGGAVDQATSTGTTSTGPLPALPGLPTGQAETSSMTTALASSSAAPSTGAVPGAAPPVSSSGAPLSSSSSSGPATSGPSSTPVPTTSTSSSSTAAATSSASGSSTGLLPLPTTLPCLPLLC